MDETDSEKLQRELSEILEYFDRLQEADVSRVEPIHSVTPENVSREDVVRPGSIALVQGLLDMFPAALGGFLKVKAIFSR